jgi:hypothetical protein
MASIPLSLRNWRARAMSAAVASPHLMFSDRKTEQSIYNILPERGWVIRIWPARYPSDPEGKLTPAEYAQKRYATRLAPLIMTAIEAKRRCRLRNSESLVGPNRNRTARRSLSATDAQRTVRELCGKVGDGAGKGRRRIRDGESRSRIH